MCRSIIILACVCLFANLSFSSSIVPYKNVEHLTQSSQIVVVVKALPEQTQIIDGYTEYFRNFEVLNTLKGNPKSIIQIKSGKRTIGDYTNIIHGEFDFHSQDTYLLFLDEMSDGSYYPVCLSYYVFEEVSKHGVAYFVPRYQEGSLQLIDKKKEQILQVYQKDAFMKGLQQYVKDSDTLDMSKMIADEETQTLTESIKKASPSHCSFLQSNNGLRYQVKNLNSQALPIYYQNGQGECANVNGELQSAIDHMNDNYSGIQLRLAGSTSGYTPDCSGNRAYNISFFGGTYDIFMEQQLGTSRAVLVQFGDPCNEMPALNNCSGTVAFGGSWSIGTHTTNGENFNTAVYGYVVVNDGMGNCNCGDFSGNSTITDFSAIMAHEISHTVGLNHIGSNFGQANMNPISGTQITNLDRQCMDDLYPASGVVDPNEETGTPDLSISSCGNVSQAGNTVTVSNIQIRNTGNENTGKSTRIGIYVSTDNIINTADRLVTTLAVAQLAAGASVNLNSSFNISGIPDGNYIVGMIVDDSNQVTESNENNNSCFDRNPRIIIDTTPAPTRDLVINNCGGVSISGNNVSVNNLTIRNTGNVSTSSGSIVSYYLSFDNTVTAADILVGSKNIPILSAGATRTINHSFNLSSFNLADGTYNVGMIIDANNVIQEVNENNNSCIDNSPSIVIDTAPPPVADLNISGCVNVSRSESIITANGLTVRNTGNANSGNGVEVGYYLSADKTIRTSDILIGTYVLPALVSGASNIVNQNFDISSLNIADGSYVLGVIVDYKNILDESNESNNTCFDNSPSIIIAAEPEGIADLIVASCGTLTVNAASASLTNVRIQNIGNLATDAGVITGFYLSTDQNITISDQSIGNVAIPILAPNTQTSINQNISTSNLNLSPGSYTVGIITDINNVTTELKENNNSCFVNNPKIIIEEEVEDNPDDTNPDETNPEGDENQDEDETLGPDLDITNCGTAQINGNTLRINNTIVRNIGDEQTNDFSYLGYYLSKNRVIRTNDIYLGYDYVASLAANSQSPESASFNLSDFDLEDGEYYIGMIADFGKRVEESNESNNACRINNPKVIIGSMDEEPEFVDLQVSCGSISQSSTAVSVDKVELYNAGNKNTDGGVFFAYYLSSDQEITTDDYLLELGQDYVPTIRSGQKILKSGHFTFNGIPVGNYYLGVIIDHRKEVDESNEANNSCHISNTIITVGQDQNGEADLIASCDESSIKGNQLNISELNIKNIGNLNTNGYSFVGYYLSDDKEITSSDYYLGYDYVGILSANQNSRQQETFQISDISLDDGEYYIGAIADFTSRLGELNTTNNTCLFEDVTLIIGDSETTEGNCQLYNENGFEDGRTGIWVDGGAHAFVNAGATFASNGLRAMAIRGNEGKESSFYTSAWIKQENYAELKVSFNYYAYLMESGDAFVLDVDTGSGFKEYKRWNADIDFKSAEVNADKMTIPVNGDMKLRFRSVTSHTYEYVFLDDILIERCIDSQNLIPSQSGAESQFIDSNFDFKVFPNPIRQGDVISLELENIGDYSRTQIFIFDTLGRMVKSDTLTSQHYQLNTEKMLPGSYNVMILSDDFRKVKRLIVLE